MNSSDRIIDISGDITLLDVDAIVNAANGTLLGGGGVDGAIHRMAGPELKSYCAQLNGCDTGDAKITPGFKLKSKWIIHAVGPRYGACSGKEPELLSSCYRRSLELALEHKIRTIAFPAISTGIYGFPKADAAEIAHKTCFQFIEKNSLPEKIFFVHFP